MERKEIEEKYTWDLSKIYAQDTMFQEDLAWVKNEIPMLRKQEGTFTKSCHAFLSFMNQYEAVSRKLSKLYEYVHLSFDVDPDNQEIQDKQATVMALYSEFQNATVFVELDILKDSELIQTYLNTLEMKPYFHFITDILRGKPHTLSPEEEKLLSLASDALDSSYETYFSFRPEFKPVTINGKEHFLDYAMLLEYLKNPNEDVRRQAYENYYQVYQDFASIYSHTLAGNTKKDVFYSKARKFDSPLEASLFEDNAPKELFYKILKMANGTYHSYLKDYVAIRKEVLKKEKLELYDMQLPLVATPDKKYSLDDAFSLIMEATKNLGPEYQSILEKARCERWIDYMPHKGKMQGAYSAGSYDTNPYILMSYTNDLESIFTLIHELGHSVHTYFSSHHQDYINSNYKIFVAEVASTVNENLLMNLLIEKAKTKEEKAYLLYRKIEETIGTMYRQPFFANFENILHEKVANNEGLSNSFMTTLYQDLTKQYWGDDVNVTELAGYSCYTVPHFYYNYYVYKYSLGYAVSSVIASRISANDTNQIEKYLTFLKSGSSQDPIDLLKKAGVDPLADEIYDLAFHTFKQDVEKLKSLL